MQNAIEAQLGPKVRHVVRAFRTLRRRRNDSEYPAIDHLPVSEEEAPEGLDDARSILDAMRTFLTRVGAFR